MKYFSKLQKMIKDPVKKAEAAVMIEKFATAFYNKFEVFPIVIYDTEIPSDMRVSLEMLLSIVNDNLYKHYPESYLKKGILWRTRKSLVVAHRQIYYYFAYKMGYSLERIATYIGFDHSSVVHGRKRIINGLELKDVLINKLYNEINHVYKEKIDVDGELYSLRKRGDKPESVVPSPLPEDTKTAL